MAARSTSPGRRRAALAATWSATWSAAWLLATLSGGAAAHDAEAPAIDVSHLSEERIDVIDVSRPAQPGKSYDAMTIMDAPVARLCALIQDYPAYPAYMPNTKNTQIVSSADDHVLVDMTLELPLGKIKRYRLQLDARQNGASCQVAWKLIPRDDLKIAETIADTTGYWLFSPLPANHNKSIVEYFVYADPGPVPYGLGWIVDIMSKKSLPSTLEALRGQAQKH